MQNGKSALAKGLVNGVAFGSTEFHVLRPGQDILGEWLHYLVRERSFRRDAESSFKGTAGQQRVPETFFQKKSIPVPPLEHIANDEAGARSGCARHWLVLGWAFLKHLPLLEILCFDTNSLNGAFLRHLRELPELNRLYVSGLSGCTGEDLAQCSLRLASRFRCNTAARTRVRVRVRGIRKHPTELVWLGFSSLRYGVQQARSL